MDDFKFVQHIFSLFPQVIVKTSVKISFKRWHRINYISNDVNNQQEVTTFSFINLFNSALHVSGDKFAHPQEHFLAVYTAFGTMHRDCRRPVPRVRWNWRSVSTVIYIVVLKRCTLTQTSKSFFHCFINALLLLDNGRFHIYTRWFKYDRDWFVCKQAALRSSCATLREWSHNFHPPSCSG